MIAWLDAATGKALRTTAPISRIQENIRMRFAARAGVSGDSLLILWNAYTLETFGAARMAETYASHGHALIEEVAPTGGSKRLDAKSDSSQDAGKWNIFPFLLGTPSNPGPATAGERRGRDGNFLAAGAGKNGIGSFEDTGDFESVGNWGTAGE